MINSAVRRAEIKLYDGDVLKSATSTSSYLFGEIIERYALI